MRPHPRFVLTEEQRRQILKESLKKQVPRILLAVEALQQGVDAPASHRSTLKRALHKVKTDAEPAGLEAMAVVAGHLERAVEAAGRAGDYELDLALVDEAALAFQEVERALPESEPALEKGLRDRARELGDKARARLRGGGLTPS